MILTISVSLRFKVTSRSFFLKRVATEFRPRQSQVTFGIIIMTSKGRNEAIWRRDSQVCIELPFEEREMEMAK